MLFALKGKFSWLLLNIRVTFPFLLEANLVLAMTQGQLKYSFFTQASLLGNKLIPGYPPKFEHKLGHFLTYYERDLFRILHSLETKISTKLCTYHEAELFKICQTDVKHFPSKKHFSLSLDNFPNL